MFWKIILWAHIFCLSALAVAGQEWEFHQIDKSDGLKDNFVFSITQVSSGAVAVISSEFVDIIKDDSINSFDKSSICSSPLTGYRGAYHSYNDNQGRLWIKDNKKFWCFNKDMELQTISLPDSCNDFFIDDSGAIFFVSQNPDNEILDLKTLDGNVFKFWADGTLTCQSGNETLYEMHIPLDSSARTSLVATDTIEHKFYQLIDGRLCLEYDISQKTWTEIFRSDKLYTISLTGSKTAIIVSRDGIWEIDLASRKVNKIEQVLLDDNSYVSSSRINSVFADRDGRIWFGTFDRGVLRGKSTQSSRLWILWIVLAMILGIPAVMVRRKFKTARQESKTDTPMPQAKNPAEEEFVEKVRNLILQNISTAGYTVEKLSQDLCIDRTGLYKKLVAITGQTPTIFIRRTKLAKATELIIEGKLSITEISERTGFSSPSYMAKCFWEETGKKPSEIKEINEVAVLFQQ